jgi:hypothetical protein
MKISDSQQFEYDCQDTQELLILLLVCPEELTIDERSEVTRHLNECPACREDYEGMLQTSDVLIANRDYLRKNAFFGDTPVERDSVQMSHEEIMDERFQDRMERVIVRRKRRERRERIAKAKRLAKPISAVAACLVVGLGVLFVVNQFSRSNNGSSTIVSNQSQPSVIIEVISEGVTDTMPAGQLIVAADELKTLRINGNRQMVLNVGTELSVESYNLGCMVKLDQGEIYTEVEHDGKPFVVETFHGQAVITGTTFNIKADSNKMDLAVVEGSVRFESEKGAVDVIGGYQSSIAASLQPTKPVACDVLEIAKWAKRQDVDSAPLVVSSNTNISELAELSLVHVPYCDLEDIIFEVWIDQRREWFEREFPWTKRLKKLLAQDNVEVDTIDLLIESGDLWRFAWPEYNSRQILAQDEQVVQDIANQYGVSIETLAAINAVSSDLGVGAFEAWRAAFDSQDMSGHLTIESIHATAFLINVRSLAWFAVREGHIQVQEKQKVLDLLAEQVRLTSEMLGDLNRLILTDKNESICSVTQYQEYIKKIISLMMEIERELREYEIVSK